MLKFDFLLTLCCKQISVVSIDLRQYTPYHIMWHDVTKNFRNTFIYFLNTFFTFWHAKIINYDSNQYKAYTCVMEMTVKMLFLPIIMHSTLTD